MRVAIGIVTWNSRACISAAIRSVRAQGEACQLVVVDNGSTDGTAELLASLTSPDERVLLPANTGFSAAQNVAIGRTDTPYYLALNPDVVMEPAFCAGLADALDTTPSAGTAGGLLILDGGRGAIDSTGIVMLPSQRHLDRGQFELDHRRYDVTEEVFGITGAAAMYRRAMLDDVAWQGEYFDEDFFAYREDADLAWRAQWLGWTALYVPAARATHARRVTPERREALPPQLNRYSVRNRFLLRLKNQSAGLAVRFAVPAIARDAQVLGYVLLREWRSLPALADVVRLLPRTLRKRRDLMRRRRRSSAEMAWWFRHSSRVFPTRAAV